LGAHPYHFDLQKNGLPQLDAILVQAFTKAIPYALGAAVLLMIVFGLYVQSIPPREVLQKAAAQHAFKVGSDGLPQFMSEATDQNEAAAKATESENVVPTLHDESPHVEETLEL